MTHFDMKLINHFAPYHELLSELHKIAEPIYPEGGMTWGFKYFHGTSHTIKIDGKYMYSDIGVNFQPELNKHAQILAKFIWSARGQPYSKYLRAKEEALEEKFNYHLTTEYYKAFQPIEQEAINAYLKQATDILDLFKNIECDKYYFHTEVHEGLWIQLDSVVIKNRHAIRHSASWSVD